MCGRSGLFGAVPLVILCLYISFGTFFPLTLPVFMISVGKRLATSTNLEYFFPPYLQVN